MKKMMAILLLFTLLFATTSQAEAPAEAAPLTGLSAWEIVGRMGIGWNIGNTFDATGYNAPDIFSHETSWGNPVIDMDLIRRVKDAGFNCIRIPITWFQHVSDDGTYTIDPAFIARVKEVVDYCYACDLYIIINMHHENWLNVPELSTDYEAIGVQLGAMWRQIADAFADYDQHLIFESMNEPRMAGTGLEWNGNKAGFEAVNYLNQVFVDVVRTNPRGYNGERALMIPGYAASSSYAAMNAITIPMVDGAPDKNIIISVHCYSPYDFCLSDKQVDFNPNNRSHTNSIDSVFANVEKLFLKKGIPVIIGETGATNTQNNTAAREAWAYYMGAKSTAYGVPIFIWDNGNNQVSGGECHVWVRRALHPKLRSQRTPYPYPTVVEHLMAGAASCERGSGLTKPEPIKSMLNGTILWGNADGLKAHAEWDSSYIQLGADEGWFVSGRTFAVVYVGSGTPKLVLDSAEKEQWWMPIDPDRIDSMAGKKVAWFSVDKVMAAVAAYGIDDASQLRNFCVISTNGLITTFEVSYIGK